MTLSTRSIKTGAILLLVLVPGLFTVSCAPESGTQRYRTIRQVMGNPPLYERFSNATELYKSQPVMLIGTPTAPYDQREQYEYQYPSANGVGRAPHHFTRAEIRVLDVIKNETENEIRPGDAIEVIELCGYGEYKGESLFVRYNEYQYPLSEDRPYALFLDGPDQEDPSGAYVQGWMGSFDIARVEPTQEERESIQENVAIAHDHPEWTTFMSSYTRFKKSIFEIPDLKEVLAKYAE